jgi:uncharacterized membrane protein (Fun14 family)
MDLTPYLPALSMGFLAGLAVGFTLKVVGKILAILIGLIFIALQLLAYEHLVQINWAGIQQMVAPHLTPQAVQGSAQQFLSIVTHNLPFAGAFIPGFWLAIRR